MVSRQLLTHVAGVGPATVRIVPHSLKKSRNNGCRDLNFRLVNAPRTCIAAF